MATVSRPMKRLNIEVEPEVLETFRALVRGKDRTIRGEITAFIKRYIRQYNK